MSTHTIIGHDPKWIDVYPSAHLGFTDLDGDGLLDVGKENLKTNQKTANDTETQNFLAVIGIDQWQKGSEINVTTMKGALDNYFIQRSLEWLAQHLVAEKTFGAILKEDLALVTGPQIMFANFDPSSGVTTTDPVVNSAQQFVAEHPLFFVMKNHYVPCPREPGNHGMCPSGGYDLSELYHLASMPGVFADTKIVFSAGDQLTGNALSFDMFGFSKAMGCNGIQVFTKQEKGKAYPTVLHYKGAEYLYPHEYNEQCPAIELKGCSAW